ncbi:hypothetical protein MED297_04537 [Reinekea sp. MED297]|uniref:Multidrug-efflux transporter n=2 Tax=Reinekea TaxID=230494 RepID=A4BGB2_9GAMM|nr:hypothetical protein MED297_04537 [Reinekea sp. MED297] [Reinekea blandensis MED297]
MNNPASIEFHQRQARCLPYDGRPMPVNIVMINRLIRGHLRRKLLHLAAPIIVQIYLFQLTGVADNIMLGQFGEQTIAALGICLQLNFLIILSYAALTQGGSVLTAQYLGARKPEQLRDTTSTLLMSALIIGLSIALLYTQLGETLLSLLTTDLFRPPAERSPLPALGYEYLQIIGIGMIPAALGQVAQHVLQALGDTRSPMKYVLFSNVLNVIGNFIFLFGGALPGLTDPIFEPMGIRGVAISTVLSWTLLASLLVRKLLKHPAIDLRGLQIIRVVRRQLVKIARIGYPLSLDGFLWQGSSFLYAMMFNRVGADAYAAFLIALMVRGLSLAIGGGLQQATAISLGQAVGGDRLIRARAIVRTSLSTALVVLPALSALIFLCTPLFLTVYDISELSRSRVIGMVGLGVVFTFTTAIAIIIPGVLRAGGDTKAPMVITFLGFSCVGLPIAWLFGLKLGFGLWGVFAGFMLDEAAKAAMMLWYLRKETWLQNMTRSD